MKLSELILELVEAKIELENAEEDNRVAREKFLDNGGYSWGYYGQSYYDRISECRSKVEELSDKIDNYFEK